MLSLCVRSFKNVLSKTANIPVNNMPLAIGDKCPDFETTTHEGSKFRFYDFVGKSNIVLYFYPKDNTPGCTAEACSFRDSWNRLSNYDVQIFGVSSDSAVSHTRFREKYNLPFTLLTDQDKRIRSLYGATGLLIPPRVTFVIDRNGIVRHVYNSQMKASNHVEESMRVLEKIKAESGEN